MTVLICTQKQAYSAVSLVADIQLCMLGYSFSAVTDIYCNTLTAALLITLPKKEHLIQSQNQMHPYH